MAAARHDSVDALEFLIQNGANTMVVDQENKTCLHLIAERYCKKALNVIIKVSNASKFQTTHTNPWINA